jgi:hypothetical protein
MLIYRMSLYRRQRMSRVCDLVEARASYMFLFGLNKAKTGEGLRSRFYLPLRF